MKKRISLLLIGIMILQLTGCNSNIIPQIIDKGPTKVEASDLTADVTPGVVDAVKLNEAFIDGQMEFAVQLLQQIVEEGKNTKENVLLSPASAQMALAMVANGANGQTKTEMEQVLAGGMPMEELNVFLYNYLLGLREGDSVKMANSIWFRDEEDRLTVEKAFLQTNADYYGANIYKSAFDEQTLKDMNVWVKEHTDGMIDSILDKIPEEAVMYLINALTFEAEWQEEYEATDIFDGTFTDARGEKQKVEMMKSAEGICYEGDSELGVKKNYKGGQYSFVALLPNEGIDIADYVAGLDAEYLQQLLQNPSDKYGEVTLPKFSYAYKTLLNDALTAMGMPTAFSAGADFSRLGRSTRGNISISRVLQKTFIAVDELGTKAGAVTSVEMKDECCPMYDLTIRFERPFVYMIVDNETNLPLFIGVLMNIEN